MKNKEGGKMKFMQGKDYPTDMSELVELLKKNKIKYKLRQHPVAKLEPQCKEVIGYFPSGDWQIIIDGEYSVIRGMISFGSYEIMKIKGDCTKGKFIIPERFEKPEDLIKSLANQDEQEDK